MTRLVRCKLHPKGIGRVSSPHRCNINTNFGHRPCFLSPSRGEWGARGNLLPGVDGPFGETLNCGEPLEKPLTLIVGVNQKYLPGSSLT